ncbi:protein serine/threonine kinase [Malassezia pachydermatis]|uniref:Protein kinase n=1 Tax=Malassezia pachydermatis TaxID=77020 RepID=A0A0M8MRA4_9BASI|nr:protein kinase [Malassezia pachydermatis]KOS15217.1 protein kinase [Malassezia pachydermatis]
MLDPPLYSQKKAEGVTTVQPSGHKAAPKAGSETNNRTKSQDPAANASTASGSGVKKARSQQAQSYAAAQQANAARREREEWERTRGAGSNVLLWYEDLRVKRSRILDHFKWTAPEVVPPIEEILAKESEPQEVIGMDRLLDWGLCDYTILPRTLGRGRFSTVYLAVKNGERYAVKHTPLFPHHELVATRLLREPTLLAELPPHPNLVQVVETIRTPGHFYLVEEFLEGYVTVEALITKLNITKPPAAPVLPYDVAEKVFDQLVLALHAIHTPLRVCHRDVKPENILVHPETLQLKLLDFGLATHFSRSRAKLTTCCGSPAFHCPEIVVALSQPPGTSPYWGPEVDAWTCGVTLLRCLSGIRYPLGTTHTSPAAMASRAKKVLASLPDTQLRHDISLLLDLDAEQRMQNFQDIADRILNNMSKPPVRTRREMKCTSFIPAPPQHAMVLPLVLTKETELYRMGDLPFPGASSYSQMTLLNTSRQPSQRVLSFIKYCFRCAGILYHTIPIHKAAEEASITSHPNWRPEALTSCTFQCVVELLEDEQVGPLSQLYNSVMSLFGQQKKTEHLVKLPSRALDPTARDEAVRPSSGPSGRQGRLKMLVFYMVVAFPSHGSETPLPSNMDLPTPEMISNALQHRFAPAKMQTPSASRRASSEEPELYIDTQVDRLPKPQVVSSPRHGHRTKSSAPRTPKLPPRHGHRTKSSAPRTPKLPPRPKTVQVYVSDARVLPYVRGALSNGGLLKSNSFATSESRPASPSPSTPSPRSGSTTPEPKHDRIGPHELGTSLEAIESSCRSLLARRISPDREDVDDTYAHQLYMLVYRLYRGLEITLEGDHADALQQEMSKLNFRALSVLGPVLALVSEHDRAPNSPTRPKDVHALSTTGSLALGILELFSGSSSAKEMCLGFQEQIERLSLAWRAQDYETIQPDMDTVAMLACDGPVLVQAALGQLQRLANLVPSIKTRKPLPLIESVLGPLYPGVYRDVIVDALSTMDDLDTREDLATQAAIVLGELILGLSSLAQQVDEESRPPLGNTFMEALCLLIPYLPVPLESQGSASPLLSMQSTKTEGISPRITVWNIVRKTLDQLDIDLGERCLGPSDLTHLPRAPPSYENSRGYFLVLVHLLAYEAFMTRVKGSTRERLRVATRSRKRLSDPQHWSTDVAQELLSRLASVMPGTLVPGLGPMDVTLSARTLACVHDVDLCDAILAMSQWCVHALANDARTRTQLDDDCATFMLRVLASIATYSSEARLRQPAFALVSCLLCYHSSDDVTLRLIREMMAPEAPAPLRGGTVHLVRDLVADRLDRLEAGIVYSDALLADGRLWRAWNDELFVLPSGQPTPPPERPEKPKKEEAASEEDDLAPLTAYLTQHLTYLQECCSLFYYVHVRDASHNYTGMRDGATYVRLVERFVQPLAAWTTQWQTYLQEHSLSNDTALMGLALLETAVARLQPSGDGSAGAK